MKPWQKWLLAGAGVAALATAGWFAYELTKADLK